MAWKSTEDVNFTPNPWYRYIFFSSLYEAQNGDIANNYLSQINNGLSSISIVSKDYQIISFIESYIQKLRDWAKNERAQEIKFLQLAKKNGIDIGEYQEGNNFSYLDFIRDLNLVYTEKEKFEELVNIHEENLTKITEALKNFTSDKKFSPKKDKDGKIIENEKDIPFINRDSIMQALRKENYSRVREGTLVALGDKKLKDVSSWTSNLSTSLSTILLTPQVLDAVKVAIGSGISLDKIKNKLLNTALEQLLKKNGPEIKDIPNNIAKAVSSMNTALFEESYTNAVKWLDITQEERIESFVNRAEKNGEELEALFEKLNEGVREDLLGPISGKDTKNPLMTPLRQAFNLYNDSKGQVTAGQLAYLRGNVSKELYKEMKKRLHNRRGTLEQKKQKVIQALTKSSKHAKINAYDFINSCIANFKISGPDSGEIMAAIRAAINEYGIAYLPGKTIQLKNDVLISYFLNPVAYTELQNSLTEDEFNDAIKIISNFGKDFLVSYKDSLENNNTNVEKAMEAWKNKLTELVDKKEKLLQKAKTSEDKAKINNLFDFLSTGISVKKYEDTSYINEGFHGGSLGGNGRVVDAIPNLVKMLDAGGISLLDVNTITSALLNSFNGSLIGRTYDQPLKDYLVAGAAMMLFDDGFANADKFLNSLTEKLRNNAPGSLHLLYLNDFYVPQSFVLEEICNNLMNLNSAIVQETKHFSSNRTSIQIHNPISYNTLRAANKAYPGRGEEVEAQRWEYIRQEAENNVTIDFLFMAGMLDILDALKAKFDKVDNFK